MRRVDWLGWGDGVAVFAYMGSHRILVEQRGKITSVRYTTSSRGSLHNISLITMVE